MEQVVVTHRATPLDEEAPDPLDEVVVAHQWHAHDLCESDPGDVVLGGSESPTDDHRVRTRQSDAKCGHDTFMVVAHVLVEVGGDPVSGEAFAQPL